jgi:threonyl-tRNA synthetase
MIVVGPREAESEAVALRDRIDGDLGSMPLQEALDRLLKEVNEKVVRQVVKSEFSALEEDGDQQHEY